jgi:hypothetical protein
MRWEENSLIHEALNPVHRRQFAGPRAKNYTPPQIDLLTKSLSSQNRNKARPEHFTVRFGESGVQEVNILRLRAIGDTRFNGRIRRQKMRKTIGGTMKLELYQFSTMLSQKQKVRTLRNHRRLPTELRQEANSNSLFARRRAPSCLAWSHAIRIIPSFDYVAVVAEKRREPEFSPALAELRRFFQPKFLLP